MELDEFIEATKEVTAFLKGLQKIIPKRVDSGLIAYLESVPKDPCAVELLRNAMGMMKGQ